jgi:hypothetical protein
MNQPPRKKPPTVSYEVPCCPHCGKCGGLLKQQGAHYHATYPELNQEIRRFRVSCKFCNQPSILREVGPISPK